MRNNVYNFATFSIKYYSMQIIDIKLKTNSVNVNYISLNLNTKCILA